MGRRSEAVRAFNLWIAIAFPDQVIPKTNGFRNCFICNSTATADELIQLLNWHREPLALRPPDAEGMEDLSLQTKCRRPIWALADHVAHPLEWSIGPKLFGAPVWVVCYPNLYVRTPRSAANPEVDVFRPLQIQVLVLQAYYRTINGKRDFIQQPDPRGTARKFPVPLKSSERSNPRPPLMR